MNWQTQNFKKASTATGPTSMGSKIAGDRIVSMNSKIGRPTVKNYADGGEVQSDGEWARGENYGDGTTGDERVAMAESPTVKVQAVAEPSVQQAEVKPQSFKEAFAENRKAGNATFEWNGKKFTTEVATGKQAPRAEAKTPTASTVNGKTFSQDVAERKAANTTEKKVQSAMTRDENYGNEGRRSVVARPVAGKGVIDTSNIDSKTLLPKR